MTPSTIRNRVYGLLFLTVSFVLGGCVQTSLSRDAVTLSQAAGSPPPPHIEGLAARHARLSGPDGQLRIFIVNGMATGAHGYSYDLQATLAERLDEPKCVADHVVPLDDTAFVTGKADRVDFPPASLRVTSWGQADKTPRLVFYELLWTPYADAYTDRYLAPMETRERYFVKREWTFCGSDFDKIPRARLSETLRDFPDRALFNAYIKDKFMVGGMTDAVLSLGPLGAAARDAIRQGLCRMVSDSLEVPARPNAEPRCGLSDATLVRFGGVDGVAEHLRQHEFAAITYSLGSFMLLDTVDEFRLWPDDLGPAAVTCGLVAPLVDRTPVYMFSNQISLLLIAHPHFGCEPGESCELYGEFGDRRILLVDPRDRDDGGVGRRSCDVDAQLDVIAFNDPDDVMGYTVPGTLTDSPLVDTVVNVRVRNPGFTIPGLLKSPESAHTHHDRNPAVIDFLLYGWVFEPEASAD